MATRLKTIEYWFPHLATIPDAIDTNFTQISVFIPETVVNFRSVYLEVTAADAYTTATNVTARNIDIQLGSAGYQASDNTQTWTQAGEQFSLHFAQNFTSYFTTNWSGTSMTMDCRININTSVNGCRNGTAKVVITYEYDDTSATHIKTVRIPLNAPTTALATAKPGTAIATIPALDTYCPEASITYRQTAITIQGNTEAAATTDISLSYEIDSAGAFTSELFEEGSNCAYSYRLANVVSFTTNATHNFFVWASAADFDHPQIWLTVTYEFNPATSTTILNSLLVPMEFSGPMGNSATTWNRSERSLWIEEPTTITVQTCALFVFYEQSAAIAGINARVGTGSFVSYSSAGNVVGGSCALMIRNDSITLTRGQNTLQADIYNTDALDPGAGLSSFWMINYHSGKATAGVGAHNHTILWNLIPTGNTATAATRVSSAITLTVPETNYFLTAIGVEYLFCYSATTNAGGCFVGVERLASGEGGFMWESVYEAMNASDPEQSIRWAYGTARSILTRFPGDTNGGNRLNFETARRWTCSQSRTADHVLNLMFTYHSITYAISGTISGSAGGTVNIDLFRSNNDENVLSTTRVGDGAYSLTWYDNTDDLYTVAYEDSTHTGRSDDSTAT